MHYMEEHEAMRSDPRLLMPGCRTVVSCILAYKPDRQMLGGHRIAQYAYGPDYHETMKRMLWRLLKALQDGAESFGAVPCESYKDVSLQGRPCVDTAPISDKMWAVRAGLGWRGHNTLFLHPRYGSYVFLGELLLNVPFNNYDSAAEEWGCGDCRLCVEACPNQALQQQVLPDGQVLFRLDARRCNSYHTIENRAPTLPRDLRLAGYVFGCDCCQTVCPHNRQAPVSYHVDASHFAALQRLAEASDESTFRVATKHTPLSRIRYPQWLRNLECQELS